MIMTMMRIMPMMMMVVVVVLAVTLVVIGSVWDGGGLTDAICHRKANIPSPS